MCRFKPLPLIPISYNFSFLPASCPLPPPQKESVSLGRQVAGPGFSMNRDLRMKNEDIFFGRFV